MNQQSPTFYQSPDSTDQLPEEYELPKHSNRTWLHILLFLATFLTTTYAGLFWLNIRVDFTDLNLSYLFMGFPYSVSLLTILGCHEFGHYFAAVYHRIKATLPYFIPFPPIPLLLNFGTFGAVIRTKEPIRTKTQLMDIGAYGPIAGFVATLLILFIGAMTLPPIDYIYSIHPNYRFLAEIPEPPTVGNLTLVVFGENLIFYLLNEYVLSYRIPMSEIYHYPLLLAGWLGLFVTALNLLPFGQLDGGHIIYSWFGEKIHKIVSYFVGITCLILGIIGVLASIPDLNFPFEKGWAGWILWGLILLFLIKPKHPPVESDEPIDKRRKIVGIISIFIFILCFMPVPFKLV